METKFKVKQAVFFIENNDVWCLPVKKITTTETERGKNTTLNFDFTNSQSIDKDVEKCFESDSELLKSLKIKTTEDLVELPF